MADESLEQELFELTQYLAASAEGLRNEPKNYGPLRLLEVLRRIALVLENHYGDEFMKRVSREINENKELVMSDPEEFYEFINRLVIELAREGKERSS